MAGCPLTVVVVRAAAARRSSGLSRITCSHPWNLARVMRDHVSDVEPWPAVEDVRLVVVRERMEDVVSCAGVLDVGAGARPA